jgi:hypothetical protein
MPLDGPRTVPIVSLCKGLLARLLHLGVVTGRGVLGSARRGDNGRVNVVPEPQRQPTLFQQSRQHRR